MKRYGCARAYLVKASRVKTPGNALWFRTASCQGLLIIHFPTNLGMSEQASERTSAAECVSKGSSAKQANECAARANDQMDEQVFQYVPIPGCSEPTCDAGKTTTINSSQEFTQIAVCQWKRRLWASRLKQSK